MTPDAVASVLLLLASGLLDHWSSVPLAAAAALAGLLGAYRSGGRRALIESVVAALVPCGVIGIQSITAGTGHLIAFPLAAAGLEVAALTRLIETRQHLIEAWLCAGARPLEILPRIRQRVRPAILVALALLVPTIASPGRSVAAPLVVTLIGIGVSSLFAPVLVSLRAFVDARLVDRPPSESRAPFRLKPYEAPPTPRVYEARPGRQPPPEP